VTERDGVRVKRVSHLGLAVRDLDAAIRLYGEVLGLELVHRWVSETDRMEAASFRVGDIEIELMRPTDADSPVGRFLASHGEGMNHISYEVADVAEALTAAREAGLRTVDEVPREGGDGQTRIGFLHPASTHGVLTELQEDVAKAGDPLAAEVLNDSGLAVKPAYSPDDVAAPQPPPGEYPYTRGIRRDMYRGRHWTMRQYAGFGTAAESNERYQFLLVQGQTGLSVAFDLPTQIGYDSDDPMADGEVGKVGVAIDSLRDMEILLRDLPVERISTSMTINATAALLLLLYQLVAEKQGCPPENITGTVQNDILKEYAARGTYIFPPKPSMRLVTDLFSYCAEHLPSWNTISISGYHIREAGSTAAEEVAFTIADAVAYVEAALAVGLPVDRFAPRLSFFFNAHMDFFEEVAKYRAARRIWARLMRERFGARDPRSLTLRFHTQTAGSSLTAQQPLNNVVRTALEAMSAVLGGTQSLHTNGYDEALGLPSRQAAELALRTQQVIAYESGVPMVADPLGGSYYVEALTDEVEEAALAELDSIEARGGAVAVIESGWMQRRIAESAYRTQVRVESGDRVIVGVNRFRGEGAGEVEIVKIGPKHQEAQAAALRRLRADRDNDAVARRLDRLEEVARGSGNLMFPLKEALAAYATIGECCGRLRAVFGEYQPPDL
jgi:methylmalonyl-CoA mutase N-terminal domain/subunit